MIQVGNYEEPVRPATDTHIHRGDQVSRRGRGVLTPDQPDESRLRLADEDLRPEPAGRHPREDDLRARSREDSSQDQQETLITADRCWCPYQACIRLGGQGIRRNDRMGTRSYQGGRRACEAS